jgi:hypothetical protein
MLISSKIDIYKLELPLAVYKVHSYKYSSS